MKRIKYFFIRLYYLKKYPSKIVMMKNYSRSKMGDTIQFNNKLYKYIGKDTFIKLHDSN